MKEPYGKGLTRIIHKIQNQRASGCVVSGHGDGAVVGASGYSVSSCVLGGPRRIETAVLAQLVCVHRLMLMAAPYP